MRAHGRGNQASKVWFIADYPSEADIKSGKIYSGGVGYVFDQMVKASGLPLDSYIYPLIDNPAIHSDLELAKNTLVALLEIHRPVIIIPLGKVPTGLLVPETKHFKKPFECKLGSYAGSILQSKFLSYQHYVIPTFPPIFVIQNWSYRDIEISIDLGHAKDEFDFWQLHGKLNPLPIRTLITEPEIGVLLSYLTECLGCEYISVDIETIRPPKGSVNLKGHCGYPYTISVAKSPTNAISFSFWDYPEYTIPLWRCLDLLLQRVPQIGQNYFSFDSHFLEAMGFRPCLDKCQDTLIRHHILWPELEHKLQFQTKQYTRQPYYKDEGKNWSPRYKKQLMRYNALDTTVTYEIFLEQEKEFAERSHLK